MSCHGASGRAMPVRSRVRRCMVKVRVPYNSRGRSVTHARHMMNHAVARMVSTNFLSTFRCIGNLIRDPKFLSTSRCFGDLVRDPKISFHILVLRGLSTGPQNFFPHPGASATLYGTSKFLSTSSDGRSFALTSMFVENCPSLCDCRPQPRSPFTFRIHVRGE